ncbi:MAG: hypothetical protein ACI4AD_06920 [Roseburia sp.]
MKKTVKKVFSTVLAAALAFGGLSLVPVTAEAEPNDYTAFLMFTDNDWAFGNWDATLESATTTVSGDGSYSVTLNASEVGGDGTTGANGAQVFCVDIVGAQADLTEQGKTFNVTDISVTADGAAVDVDASKLVTGDIEENGNYRIEIYNVYGDTAADAPIDAAAFTFADSVTVDFTLETVDLPADDGAAAAEVSTEQTAFLMFTDNDWAFGNWDATLESATTTVSGDGTYTVTLNASEVGGDGSTGANGAQVFCVDVVGLGASVTDISAISLDDISVTADGAEVAVDASKIVTGDIEENGNYRIEIFNVYGDTAADAPIDAAAFTFTDNVSVTFTLSGIAYGAPAASEDAGAADTATAEINLDGTYNAYLGLQTPNWTYRDPWNSANGIGSDYWGQFIYGNETSEKYGTVTDAVIEGNGTYTVSITDFGTIFADDFATAGQEYFNLLYISTDIPLSDSIKVTDVTLKIDGKTVTTYADAVLDPDESEYVKILIQNVWNEDVAELPYYNVPSDKVEMSFTVSGFNYDNPNAAVAEESEAVEEPAATEAAAADTTADTATESSSNTTTIVIVVVVIVVIAAIVAVVIVSKKKKESK